MPSGRDYANQLLEEARSTFAPHISDLQEALQGLRAHLADSLDQLGPKLEAIRSIELPSAESIIGEAIQAIRGDRNREISQLAEFVREARGKETQEEILTSLLDAAHRYAPRVILFVIRGDQLSGWASRGYGAETEEIIRACSFLKSESPAMLKALETSTLVTVADPSGETRLSGFHQGEEAAAWHIFPMTTLKRPVAALMALDADESKCELDPLSIIMETTALCIENMALKIIQDLKQGVPFFEASPAAPIDAPLLATILEAAKDEPKEAAEAATTGEPAEDTLDLSGFALDEEIPEPVVGDVVAPGEVELPETGEEPVAEHPASVLEKAVEAELPQEEEWSRDLAPQEVLEPESTPEEPAALFAAEAPPGPEEQEAEFYAGAAPEEIPPAPVEEGLEKDARRFARLLVSEIKLYNEQQLLEGREKGDIYNRLKRDIDRSREMFERRFPSAMAWETDCFHDEVVRILAENDSSRLGSDYPGPRLES